MDANQKERVKLKLMQKIKTQAVPANSQIPTFRLNKLKYYVAATLTGLVALGGTAFASNSAKPGDLLFPVKKATEQVRLGLTFSQNAKTNLKIQFAQERVRELSQIEQQEPATTTPPSEFKHHETARFKAQAEVDAALTDLKAEGQNFAAQGNTTTAEHINKEIEKIHKKLNPHQWDSESKNDLENLQDDRAETGLDKLAPSDFIIPTSSVQFLPGRGQNRLFGNDHGNRKDNTSSQEQNIDNNNSRKPSFTPDQIQPENLNNSNTKTDLDDSEIKDN